LQKLNSAKSQKVAWLLSEEARMRNFTWYGRDLAFSKTEIK
jgi:hypothetical protein